LARARSLAGTVRGANNQGLLKTGLEDTLLAMNVSLGEKFVYSFPSERNDDIMQTIAGYYHYELLQYFKELYIIVFPQIMAFALLAMFIQTVVSNKFVGHAIAIGLIVLVPILFNFGWENTLYLYDNTPPYTYSDMNGYGHFVPALTWSLIYWLAVSAFFGVISIALARRGTDEGLRARLSLAAGRAPRRCIR